MAMLLLLLIGGHETTVNLIANGLLALLRNPDQLALFASTPGIEAQAVDELLRFDAPVQYTAGWAKTDVEISGVCIPSGSILRLILAAANRDPEVFEHPDTLDLRRSPCPHLSFGMGIHSCLGGPLARLEAQIALPALLRRFPTMRLAEGVLSYRPATVLRGLEELPIRF